MNQEKIGNFIAQCRKEKKLTQTQLAEKLDISNKAISKWETGRGIKGTSWFIRQALQTIDFELNNVGGSVKSEAVIEATKSAIDYDKERGETTKSYPQNIDLVSIEILE